MDLVGPYNVVIEWRTHESMADEIPCNGGVFDKVLNGDFLFDLSLASSGLFGDILVGDALISHGLASGTLVEGDISNVPLVDEAPDGKVHPK